VVDGHLGEGGMGVVLRVSKSAAGIAGAMKIMRPALAREPSWKQRFLAEARLLATLRHPNIVEVIDYDTLADGTPFFVMALLHGETLRRWMGAARADGVAVKARTIFTIASQLCEGLLALHSQERPVVHADVKPENIFLQDGEHLAASCRVKLLDFGLARTAGHASKSLLGTPRYMAPEQLRGEPVSERADQYSAALVTYELLTGRFPWDLPVRTLEATIDAHLTRSPAPPSTFCPWLPPRVDETLVRALAKRPAERWSSVAEFAKRMRDLQALAGSVTYETADVTATASTIEGPVASPGPGDLRLDPEPLGDGLSSTVPGRAPPEIMRRARAEGEVAPSGAGPEPDAVAPTAQESHPAPMIVEARARPGHPRLSVAGTAALTMAALIAVAIFAADESGTQGTRDRAPAGTRSTQGAASPAGTESVVPASRAEPASVAERGTRAFAVGEPGPPALAASAPQGLAPPPARPAELEGARRPPARTNEAHRADASSRR
jgi:serine/threonine-protein kinase